MTEHAQEESKPVFFQPIRLSNLIELAKKALERHGDLDVAIETERSGYDDQIVTYCIAYEAEVSCFRYGPWRFVLRGDEGINWAMGFTEL